MGRDGMNRREFLGWLGKGAAVGAAGGLIVPAAKKIWQVPVQLEATKWTTLNEIVRTGGDEWDGLDKLIDPGSIFNLDGDCIDFGNGEVITEEALNRAIKELRENFSPKPMNVCISSRTYESLEASLKKITFDADSIRNWKGWGKDRTNRIINENIASLTNRVERELFSGNGKA